jgi:prepilin-type N-terminal cleavage/methylation domain-containing protein
MTKRANGFTLTELLVSIAVLTALVLLFSRLFISATSLTTSGNKRMDTDAQVRPLFERVAVDFAQMIKRSDVDFFGKGTGVPNSVGGSMPGNDQLAFYSNVPGYHSSGVSPSPISVVAYRIGANKLERMAKALLWNGDTGSGMPMVFLPLTIATNWPTATDLTAAPTPEPDAELIGPYVFRFEYYYILKNGTSSVTPWDASAGHTSATGLQDVAAISISMAALDPKSRLLISDGDLSALAGTMNDFSASMNPGDLLSQWQRALYAATGLARPSISSVRLYEHTFSITPKL